MSPSPFKALLSAKPLIVAFHVFVFFWLAIRYFLDEIQHGGNIWTTADWFVSYRFGFVRRGAIGSVIEILTNNQEGSALLISLFVLTHLIVAVYFLLICRIFLFRSNLGSPVILALLLSPIYVVFWLVNPLAYLRKELLALVTIAFTAYSVMTKVHSRRRFVQGLLIWSFAILSHESALLIAPALVMFLVHQLKQGDLEKREVIYRITSLIILPLVLVLLLNRFKWLSPEFCSYIINKGLTGEFCREGGIAWAMNPDMYANFMASISQTVDFYTPNLFIIFIFMMIPIFTIGGKKSILLTFSLLIFSLPVFLSTYDWGRWLFIIGNCVLFFVLATTQDIIKVVKEKILFASIPLSVVIQLPFCCSTGIGGGLLQYLVTVFGA